MSKSHSLMNQVLTRVLLPFALLTLGIGLWLGLSSAQDLQKNLQGRLEALGNRTAFIAGKDLFEYNAADLRRVLNYEMSDPAVLALVVEEKDGDSFKFYAGSRRRQGDEGAVNMTGSEDPANLFDSPESFSVPVSWNDNEIGRLTVWFDPRVGMSALLLHLAASVGSLVLMSSLMLLIIWFVFRTKVLKPLREMEGLVQDLSQGDGDLTKRLPVRGQAEMARLALNFNDFVEDLQGLVVNIQRAMETTRTSSNDLAASTEETAAALEEIRTNLEFMKNKAVTLDGVINQSHEAVQDFSGLLNDLGRLIQTQGQEVAQSSSAIEEMGASIQSVAKTAEMKVAAVQDLQDIAKSGEKTMEETLSLIQKVTTSTNLIMDLLKVINQIAAQTNLLAMNAAIEAAHAGEAGRGFAVVADEIRKLATSSGANAKNISASLKEILSFAKVSQESAVKSGEYFKNIVGGVDGVSTSIYEIKNAMLELAEGSRQITGSLQTLVNAAHEVDRASQQMNQRVNGLTESLDSVANISRENRNGMEEVAIGINEIYTAVHDITKAGTVNSQNIAEVDRLLKKFKV